VKGRRARDEGGVGGRGKELPYASWICAPRYLLDEGDSLDKVDRERLVPLAQTVTEMVRNFMVMP